MCIECVKRGLVEMFGGKIVMKEIGTATPEQLAQLDAIDERHEAMQVEAKAATRDALAAVAKNKANLTPDEFFESLKNAGAEALEPWTKVEDDLEKEHNALWKSIVESTGHAFDENIEYGIDKETRTVSYETIEHGPQALQGEGVH